MYGVCGCCVCVLQLMFDFNPKEDVPWFDGSLARLYEYFENTPEVWADAGEFMKVRDWDSGGLVHLLLVCHVSECVCHSTQSHVLQLHP